MESKAIVVVDLPELTVHHIPGIKNELSEKDVLDLCPRYFDDVLQVL